jgi:hypothetical protein
MHAAQSLPHMFTVPASQKLNIVNIITDKATIPLAFAVLEQQQKPKLI